MSTIKCESDFSPTVEGDDHDSWGIAQISHRWHPEVTRSQAMNPEWSLNWMASEWNKGRANRWSCYRLLKVRYGDDAWLE